MTCTFFGHHDTPDSVAPRLESLLKHVIEADGVRKFYVGSQGKFDSLVKHTLFKLKESYPDIVCYVALYTFVKKDDFDVPFEKILFDGWEYAYPRFRIDYRNRCMMKDSDMVISYVISSCGGAAKYTNMARRQRKAVYNLADNSAENFPDDTRIAEGFVRKG